MTSDPNERRIAINHDTELYPWIVALLQKAPQAIVDAWNAVTPERRTEIALRVFEGAALSLADELGLPSRMMRPIE